MKLDIIHIAVAAVFYNLFALSMYYFISFIYNVIRIE